MHGGTKVDMPRAIIVAATIIGISIVASSGIYSFSSVHMGASQRYNKFTGSVSLCAMKQGCMPMVEEKDFFVKE